MKARMTTSIAGNLFSLKIGDIVEGERAASYVKLGLAVPIAEPKAKKERAVKKSPAKETH